MEVVCWKYAVVKVAQKVHIIKVAQKVHIRKYFFVTIGHQAMDQIGYLVLVQLTVMRRVFNIHVGISPAQFHFQTQTTHEYIQVISRDAILLKPRQWRKPMHETEIFRLQQNSYVKIQG